MNQYPSAIQKNIKNEWKILNFRIIQYHSPNKMKFNKKEDTIKATNEVNIL